MFLPKSRSSSVFTFDSQYEVATTYINSRKNSGPKIREKEQKCNPSEQFFLGSLFFGLLYTKIQGTLQYAPQCYFPSNTGYVAEDSLTTNPTTLKKSSISVKNPYGQDFDELLFQANEIGSAIHIVINPKGVKR